MKLNVILFTCCIVVALVLGIGMGDGAYNSIGTAKAGYIVHPGVAEMIRAGETVGYPEITKKTTDEKWYKGHTYQIQIRKANSIDIYEGCTILNIDSSLVSIMYKEANMYIPIHSVIIIIKEN